MACLIIIKSLKEPLQYVRGRFVVMDIEGQSGSGREENGGCSCRIQKRKRLYWTGDRYV